MLNEGIDPEKTDVDGSLTKNKSCLTLINTNARSFLCPKIDSLQDCMRETEAAVAVVMET